MLERLLIAAVIVIVLIGLEIVWRWYKGYLARSIVVEQAADQPTLLYFTADYCAPCKLQQSPIIDRLSVRLGDRILIRTIDVTSQPDLARHYKVLTLPTTIVLHPNGQVAHINYGLTDQARLEAQLF